MFAVANLVHNGFLPWDSGDKEGNKIPSTNPSSYLTGHKSNQQITSRTIFAKPNKK